ncbi:MAG: diacylglycerol kinase family lipid kinase [Sphingobacteriales bacterium]|nr:MAG: diacylglycerol kinase family lipid kinase [Sphingobacteriales bacterium]
MKFLFIMNPVSGGKNKGTWETAIRDYFRDSPHKCEIYSTNGENDAESLRYWVDDWKPDKVVAVGGDGTLKQAAEILLHKNIPLAVFPAGSANGMARELQMPQSAEECFKVLFEGEARPTDIIRINERQICLHLSDIGLNAQLVKYFEENDVRGKIGYAREVLKVLWKRTLMNVRIKKGDETIVRNAFMVVLANASMYGTGARINPMGDLHDGLFEVVILRKLSLTELFKMLFLNRPFNPKKTEVLQADLVSLDIRKRAYFQIDGEYLGKTTRVTARIEKAALMLIFPPGHPSLAS